MLTSGLNFGIIYTMLKENYKACESINSQNLNERIGFFDKRKSVSSEYRMSKFRNTMANIVIVMFSIMFLVSVLASFVGLFTAIIMMCMGYGLVAVMAALIAFLGLVILVPLCLWWFDVKWDD